MYKLLLCWRYLRTRWIALASVISVTLGVATMIVVNAVMAGFSHEMQSRIHGILSDIVFESHSLSGFQDPNWHMEEIRRAGGDAIAGMTPTVAVPAMLSFQIRDQWVTRQVMFIGIDEKTHASVSDFDRYLQHPSNRAKLSFDLREGGYDTVDSQSNDQRPTRPALANAGWPHRRERVARERIWRERLDAAGVKTPDEAASNPVRPVDRQVDAVLAATGDDVPAEARPPAEGNQAASIDEPPRANPFAARRPEEGRTMDPAKEQFTGIVPGIGLASFRDGSGVDRFLATAADRTRSHSSTP